MAFCRCPEQTYNIEDLSEACSWCAADATRHARNSSVSNLFLSPVIATQEEKQHIQNVLNFHRTRNA